MDGGSSILKWSPELYEAVVRCGNPVERKQQAEAAADYLERAMGVKEKFLFDNFPSLILKKILNTQETLYNIFLQSLHQISNSCKVSAAQISK